MPDQSVHIARDQEGEEGKEPSPKAGAVVQLRDPAVFEAIWHKQQPHLLFLANRFLANEQAAEDVATDCFVKLWYQQPVFTSEFAVIGWLRTAVRNACLNVLKQERTYGERLREMNELLHSLEDDWHAEDLLAYRLQELHTQIAALPERAREIFTLRYLKGLRNEAVAERLGISHQTVRNQLTIALKTLRLSLRHREDLLQLLLILCAATGD